MVIRDATGTMRRQEAGRQSYAQWVRRAIGLARGSDRKIVSLFESSVPEPRALLRDLVARSVEPDFDHFYVSAFAGGNPFALQTLAARYGVSRDRVLATTGGTGGLSLLFRTFGHAGSHALIETPGFDLFDELAADRGMQVEFFGRRAPAYSIDPDEVAAKLRPETRLIVITNLHNPSGMALDHEVMVKLARLAEANGSLLVVDEVYGDYASAETRPCPAAAISPAAVSVSSLTKLYGLATLRCGWIVGGTEVIAAVRDVDSRLEFSRSNLAHAVGARILDDPTPFDTYTDEMLTRSRPVVEKWLASAGARGLVEARLPTAGCIFFPRLIGIDDTEAFAEQLITERGLIVAPGEYFGVAGHVRIGFGLPAEQLGPALDELTDAVAAYRSAPPPRERAYALR